MYGGQKDDITCERCEELISRACDGECTREERAAVERHIECCSDCSAFMRDCSELAAAMKLRDVLRSCPPPPRVIMHGPARRSRLWIAASAACALLCLGLGALIGYRSGTVRVAEYISPMSAVTPSMWAANSDHRYGSVMPVGSELPFAESIKRCRAAVADELRADDVDWAKVRSLLEAMGELRTDIELLTIHMAYLDINTGQPSWEVADRWQRLCGDERDSEEAVAQ